MLLASCGAPSEGKALSDYSNPDSGDSLLYYFGQMRAEEYWRDARNDSLLQTEAARRSYLEGLEDGLKALKDDKNYNIGFLAGVEMASNCIKFEKDYNMKLHTDVLFESIAYGLRNDSVDNRGGSTDEFYKVLGRLNIQREEAEKSISIKEARIAGLKEGMAQTDKALYGKVLVPGNGPMLVKGDRVKVNIRLVHNGTDLGLPLPDEMVVGDRYIAGTINKILLTMHEGEKARFVTTAYELFHRRSEQLNLKPEDIIEIEITTGAIITGGTVEMEDGVDQPDI